MKASTPAGPLTIRRVDRAHVRERVREVASSPRTSVDGAPTRRRDDHVEDRSTAARPEPDMTRADTDARAHGTRSVRRDASDRGRRAGRRDRARRHRARARPGSRGYQVPLASGATYLRVQKLAPSAHADRSGRPERTVLRAAGRQRLAAGCRRRARRRAAPRRHQSQAAQGDDARHPARHLLERRQDQRRQRGGRRAGAGRRPSAASSACPSATWSTSTSPASTALVDGVGGLNMNVPTVMHDTYSGAYFQPGAAAHERRRRRSRSRATATTSRRATSSAPATRVC